MENNIIIDENTIILFAGSKFTVSEFCDEFCMGDMDSAMKMIEAMMLKGKASIEGQTTVDTKARAKQEFEKFKNEQIINEAAERLKTEELNEDSVLKQAKDAYIPKSEKIGFDFTTYYGADKFLNSAIKAIKKNPDASEIVFSNETNLYTVIIYEVTQNDINLLCAMYNAERAVNFTTKTIDKGANIVTGAVKYTAHHVAVPVLKTGLRASGSLIKGLLSTGAKVVSSVITTTADTAKEVKDELANDADIIKANAELNDIKFNINQKIGSAGIANNGIHRF